MSRDLLSPHRALAPGGGANATALGNEAAPALHLVQLLPNAGVGGAERIALELVRCAAAIFPSWHQSFIVMQQDEDQVSDILREVGIAATSLYAKGRLDARAIWRLNRATANRGAPTIIHAHMARPAVLAWAMRLVTRRKDTCILYTAHSRLEHPVARGLSRLAGLAADHVVAVSDAVAESLTARAFFARGLSGKLQVIPNGIDLGATEAASRGWEQVREDLKIPASWPVLVVPANIRHAKGHDVLFRALALLGERDLALLLPGREESIAGQWRVLAEQLGVAPRVHWLGFRTDLPRLLRAADVVVMPSRREGLPLALLEAMALGGLPVVTDVGEMGALVRQAGGWVVQPEQPRALAAALEEALAGGQRHQEARNRAAVLVRERYSSTAMLCKYAQCYRRMAAELRDGTVAGRTDHSRSRMDSE